MFQFRGAILLCLATHCFAAKFPDSFMFGTATSAFQIEGAWDEDGKGRSQWDTFTHYIPIENANVACDSYHRWQEDVAHVKALGSDFYRFSISWSRILPDGTLNKINQKGIDYYMNLIKALKAEGIEPVVTIFHWDMPQHFFELGGFMNPQFVDYFGDFARLCYQLYAPYVKYWITINEPTGVCNRGPNTGCSMIPGTLYKGDGIYQCAYVLLKAHARAYRIYEEEFKSKYNGQLALVLNVDWMEPETNSTLDLEAQERALEFILGWYANPIFIGNWPQLMIDRIANRSSLEGLPRSRLPQFTEEEIAYIHGTQDFFALNTYGTTQVKYQEEAPISYPAKDFDTGVNSTGSIYYPEGNRKLVNFINERYRPSGIFITENGFTTGDTIDDQERITALKDFLGSFLDAIVEDKINVFGYALWSLMDNFEWGRYWKKFGIIRVDFSSENRTRTWKESAKWYQKVIAARSLDD